MPGKMRTSPQRQMFLSAEAFKVIKDALKGVVDVVAAHGEMVKGLGIDSSEPQALAKKLDDALMVLAVMERGSMMEEHALMSYVPEAERAQAVAALRNQQLGILKAMDEQQLPRPEIQDGS